jgi:cytochrome P450
MKELGYPPGPESVWRAYLQLFRDPLEFAARMAREYGDLVHLRAGSRHDYLINHPDLIKSVLLAGEEEMWRSFPRPMKRVMGQGLLTSQGEFHRRQRNLIRPSFHHEHMPAFGLVITRHSLRLAEEWKDRQQVDIFAAMLRLSIGVVSEALFGGDISGNAEEIAGLMQVLVEMTRKTPLPFAGELAAKLRLPQVRRYEKARARMNAIIYRMIEERRQEPGEGSDLLSSLLRLQHPQDGSAGISDEQVRDEVITIFMAGHETVASALAWTWYLLSQHPEIEERLHRELQSVLGGRAPTAADLPSLTYTAMVLAESMRLYPPVWLMVRRPMKDWALGGYIAPASSYLHVSQYVMHRDARYFPNPERFDPERWTAAGVATRPKFCYFPFGAGSRKCVGEGLAWLEGIVVLATLAQHCSPRLVPGHRVEPQPLVTLRPKYGILMTVHHRAEKPQILTATA